MTKTKHNRYKKSPDRDRVTCKCPMCEVLHDQYIRWIGRGTPRVYCNYCYSHRVGVYADTTAARNLTTTKKKRRYG